MRRLLAICWYELLHLLRDRRTLALLFMLPLVIAPVARCGALYALAKLAHAGDAPKIAVTSALPALTEAALSSSLTTHETANAAATALAHGDLDVVVSASANVLTVDYDALRPASAAAGKNIRNALLDAQPLRVVDGQATSPRAAADLRGRALAVLALLLIVGFASAPATESGAADRERGILAVLIEAGASPFALLTGKAIVLAAIGSIAVLANFAVLLYGVHPAPPMLALVPVTLAAVALVTTLLVAASAGARNVREAQVFSEYVQLPVVLLGLLACAPMPRTILSAAVPLFGTVMALRTQLAGDATLPMLAVNVVVTLTASLAVLWLGARALRGRRA